jgi:PadR family transcriptional regulator, regulatory protein PadR
MPAPLPLDNEHISAYKPQVRRKPGALLPIEVSICIVAADFSVDEFHGYEIAKQLAEIADHRLLTGYGTLYRALARLEEMGLLQSRREDPAIAARESRPGRRLYTLTATGEAAAVAARKERKAKALPRRPRRLVKA